VEATCDDVKNGFIVPPPQLDVNLKQSSCARRPARLSDVDSFLHLAQCLAGKSTTATPCVRMMGLLGVGLVDDTNLI
jgi:hypothetical protein